MDLRGHDAYKLDTPTYVEPETEDFGDDEDYEEHGGEAVEDRELIPLYEQPAPIGPSAWMEITGVILAVLAAGSTWLLIRH